MKTFITECRVGELLRAVGEGNGKKVGTAGRRIRKSFFHSMIENLRFSRFQLSKRRAAEKMLKLLETLPPPPRPPVNSLDRKRFAKRLAYVKSQNRYNKDKANGTVNEKFYRI